MTTAGGHHCVVDLSSDSDEEVRSNGNPVFQADVHSSTSGRKRLAVSPICEDGSLFLSKHLKVDNGNSKGGLAGGDEDFLTQHVTGKEISEQGRYKKNGANKSFTLGVPSEPCNFAEVPMKEVDSDDDCCILEVDPEKATNKDEVEDDDADLVVTKATGPVACRDFPHARHSCATHPFNRTPHSTFCPQCHCFVCDSPVPSCKQWGDGTKAADHCHANDQDQKWKFQRKCHKSRASGVNFAGRTAMFNEDPVFQLLSPPGVDSTIILDSFSPAEPGRVCNGRAMALPTRGSADATLSMWRQTPAAVNVMTSSTNDYLWTMATHPAPLPSVLRSTLGSATGNGATQPVHQQQWLFGESIPRFPRPPLGQQPQNRAMAQPAQSSPATPLRNSGAVSTSSWQQGQRNNFLEPGLAEAEGPIWHPALSHSTTGLLGGLYSEILTANTTAVRSEGQIQNNAATHHNQASGPADNQLLCLLRDSSVGVDLNGHQLITSAAPATPQPELTRTARYSSSISSNGSVTRAKAAGGSPGGVASNLLFGVGVGAYTPSSGGSNIISGIEANANLLISQQQQQQQLSYQPGGLFQQGLYQQQAATPNHHHLAFVPTSSGLQQQAKLGFGMGQASGLNLFSSGTNTRNTMGGYSNPVILDSPLLGNICVNYHDTPTTSAGNSISRSSVLPDLNASQLPGQANNHSPGFQAHHVSLSTVSPSTTISSNPLAQGAIPRSNPLPSMSLLTGPRMATSTPRLASSTSGTLPSAYSSLAYGSPLVTPSSWHHGSAPNTSIKATVGTSTTGYGITNFLAAPNLPHQWSSQANTTFGATEDEFLLSASAARLPAPMQNGAGVTGGGWHSGLDLNRVVAKTVGSEQGCAGAEGRRSQQIEGLHGSTPSPASSMTSHDQSNAALTTSPQVFRSRNDLPTPADAACASSTFRLAVNQPVNNQPLGSLPKSLLPSHHLSPAPGHQSTRPASSDAFASFASQPAQSMFPTNYDPTPQLLRSTLGRSPERTPQSTQSGSLIDWDLGLDNDTWSSLQETALPEDPPLLSLSSINGNQQTDPPASLEPGASLGRTADWDLNGSVSAPLCSRDLTMEVNTINPNSGTQPTVEGKMSIYDGCTTSDTPSANMPELNFLSQLKPQSPATSPLQLSVQAGGGMIYSVSQSEETHPRFAGQDAQPVGNLRILIKGPAPPADYPDSETAKNGSSVQEPLVLGDGQRFKEDRTFTGLMGMALDEGRTKSSSHAEGSGQGWTCSSGKDGGRHRKRTRRPGKSKRLSLMGEWLDVGGVGEGEEDAVSNRVRNCNGDDEQLRWGDSRSRSLVNSDGNGWHDAGTTSATQTTQAQEDGEPSESLKAGESPESGGVVIEGDVSPLGGSGVSEDEALSRDEDDSPRGNTDRHGSMFWKENGAGREWEAASFSPQGSPCGGHVDNELWHDSEGNIEDVPVVEMESSENFFLCWGS